MDVGLLLHLHLGGKAVQILELRLRSAGLCSLSYFFHTSLFSLLALSPISLHSSSLHANFGGSPHSRQKMCSFNFKP